jgi:hypothetical protein
LLNKVERREIHIGILVGQFRLSQLYLLISTMSPISVPRSAANISPLGDQAKRKIVSEVKFVNCCAGYRPKVAAKCSIRRRDYRRRSRRVRPVPIELIL